MWKLHVFEDSRLIDTVPLDCSHSSSAGSAVENDIVLADCGAEPEHFTIFFDLISWTTCQVVEEGVSKTEKNSLCLLDMNTHHGTFLNHMRVPPGTYAELKSGDTITIGHDGLEAVPREGHTLREYRLIEE
ncbi:hypothetical protein KIPB_006613 [Kipferlia bialata]|uniref:FHA domain-containing protein n=1 Tax=Kipferlia bialata TaxID=797122 RepID=A0A9K3D0H5_9EUKA|nr:hypothetical protein KIPB_006613 [Kipferlia bialata]|eukprot:g6613.t1